MKRPWLVPLAGILAVVLFVIAFAVGGETPDADDSLRKIVSFYRDNDSDQQWAAALLTWGTAGFLLFASGLWRFFRNVEPERRGATTLVVIGSALFAAGSTLFAGITFTLGDAADDLGPGALQTLNAMNSDMFFTVALGTFTFLVGTGVSVLQTGALPKWLGWVSVVLGVLALTPVGFFAFLGLGLWILIVSVLLYMRESATPAPGAP
jgi:Domain of unknown function (DUF4386)